MPAPKISDMSVHYIKPKYWFTWIGLGLLRLVSSVPWRLVARFSEALGLLVYWCYRSRRAIAVKNLSSCFPNWPEDQINRTVKRSFQFGVQAALFTGVAWWAPVVRYKNLVDCNTELLDQAVASGKNVIVLTPHFMGLETAGIYLSMDRRFMTMYQYAKNALIHRYIVSKRGRFGGELIERKEPLRKMLKLIKSGTPLYYLPDQDAGHKGRFSPFFGVQASTFDMLGKLTQLTDAVVLPCSVEIREKGQGMKIIFYPELANFPTGDDDQDVLVMNQQIESLIKKMPEQYLWAHKRFKTRPEGEQSFYD